MTTPAERKLRKSPPAIVRDRMLFASFFATGALIGVSIALAYVDHGYSPLLGLLIGSVLGCFGAWAVFLVGICITTFIRIALSPVASDPLSKRR